MSKKKIEVESINTASRMSENVTPSSNSNSESKKGNQNGGNSNNNSESKKGNKNNNKVENLANQLKKTGFNREKTPSPVKKKNESTKTKSENKTPSPVKKKSGSTKTNSNIPRFSPGSALKSNGGVSSGDNITFSTPSPTPKSKSKSKSPTKTSPKTKTRTLETIPSGQNITFNSTKAKTGVNSASSGVSKMSIASTVVPNKSGSKKNEGSEYNSSIRNLKANINRLEKTYKRVGMPISTYRRQIANLQRRLGALENLKRQNKTPQKSKNTSLNTSSTSLRSYTSLEASIEKGRNRRKTPSPDQTPQNMSINSLRTPSSGSPMSINGSRVGSVGSGSSRRRYTGLRNSRRNLSYNMSQVVNAQAGESSREAENSKKSKKKSKNKSKK